MNNSTQKSVGQLSDTDSPTRVPQNCPRTYKLIIFDPDNDQAICRYGTDQDDECSGCQLPSGFRLNQTRIKEKVCYMLLTNILLLLQILLWKHNMR